MKILLKYLIYYQINLFLISFAVVSLFLPQSAVAGDDEITVLDTMIVTESGTKRRLLDTNASISVLTEKDIKDSGQTRTADLISSIPGVVNQKAGSKTYFSIRGTRSSLSGGAAIYVDGRPINVGIYGYSKIDTIPIANIKKIEVIKSPCASQYGANAARGVILITTRSGRDAGKPVEGYASAEYGSWDTMKAVAGISGASSRVDYSLSGYGMESDGYRHNNEKTRSADGQVGYRFDWGNIDFVAGINDSFTNYPKGLPLWQVEKDRTASGYNTRADGSGYDVLPSETDQELINAALKLDYDKNNWLFNTSLIFTRDNEIYTQMKDFNNPSINAKRDDYRDDRLEKQYDVRINGGRIFDFGQHDMSDTITLGADYKYAQFDQERSYPFNTTALSASMISGKNKADIDATRKLAGLNLNNDLTMDKFRLLAGLRLNDMEYRLENKVPDSVKVDYSGDLDWSISPSYRILENANLFVTYNHSNYYLPLGYYKLDMQYAHPDALAQDLKPEQYNSWETGFKHQMSKAFNYSIIYYHTKIDDKVVAFYDGASFRGYRNAGTSIHKGIELEIDGRPVKWLGYRLGFTTIDAKWDSGVAKAYVTPDAASTSVINLAGKTVHYVPEYEYTAGLDIYPFQDKPYGSLIVSMDIHGFGEQYEDYNNNLKMAPANFVDLKLTWSLDRFECYFTCTNVFDRQWDKYSNSTGKDHTRLTGGTTGIYPQNGRYIGMGVSFRF